MPTTTASKAGKRGAKADGLSVKEIQQEFLKHLGGGLSIDEALNVVSRARTTYELWRRNDREFAMLVDKTRMGKKWVNRDNVKMPFPAFSEKYLGVQVFPHIQNVVDLVDGNEPSWLHPSMQFERGERDLLLVNMAPESSKTISLTINMSTFLICMDPNSRIIIVSKSQAMARKMLYAIKTRLTHPRYKNMQLAYGPANGFDSNSEAWNADRIYVSDDIRDSGEKDPTVEALGIGSHVYGARADLIILDDAIDLSNAHNFDAQIEWIQTELLSRLSANGRILIVGTRLAGRDLYVEVRDPKRYPDDVSPWTYLAMPAVLEYADDPVDWVTLWPRTNIPEPGDRDAVADADGLFPKWDGPRLARKRARMSPKQWQTVYQQQQTSDDDIFSMDMIRGCVNGSRMKGLIPANHNACRGGQGMDGLICVAGLDPATTGHTAAVVAGLDPRTHQRFVLDVFDKAGLMPDAMRTLIKTWTMKYNIKTWVIERNAFQGFLTNDTEIKTFLTSQGCILKPHFTSAEKHDPDFGVAAMASMFSGWDQGKNLIELPSTSYGDFTIKAFVEQLATWAPGLGKNQRTDMVMALWMCMLGINERDKWGDNKQTHVNNRFLSPRDQGKRRTVSVEEYMQALSAGRL